MKAMILAAGKGTRLGPLTEQAPKPLIALGEGVCIIDVTVERLLRAGVREIAVNLHHHGEQVRSHLETQYPEVGWEFFPEDELLNTGGGIYNARSFLRDSEHFVVSNSDIFHFIPVNEVIKAHIAGGCRATLVLKPSGAERAVVFCPERGVLGFTNPHGEMFYGRHMPEAPVNFGEFCGIQILHHSLFDLMDEGAFSIIDTYDAMIAAGERVHVFDADDLYWSDLGTPDSLEAGRRVFAASRAAGDILAGPPSTLRSVFKGAGDKEVVRVEKGTRSVIAVTSSSADELDDLARRSRFLSDHGVKVPKVLAQQTGSIVAEDGGPTLLQLLSENEVDSHALDVQAVELLVALAKVPVDEYISLEGEAARAFDLENVLFDIRYFNHHVLGCETSQGRAIAGQSGLDVQPLTVQVCKQAAEVAWSWFAGQPTVLMHRDFQSSNLVVDDRATVRLVDLSTLRTGYSVYDLAGFAFDIYLPHREERFDFIVKAFFERFPDLDRMTFWGAAWLRLLQATATAFRFAECPIFAASIPRCFDKLRRVMDEPAAAAILKDIPGDLTQGLNQFLRSGETSRSL